MDLSMNSRLRVPAESSSYEIVPASGHVAYSCRVNSKSHNPSGRGFDPHPPHRLTSGNSPISLRKMISGHGFGHELRCEV
jgi:hypothetical protein